MMPLVARLQRFTRLSGAEIDFLERLNPGTLEVAGQTVLSQQGERQEEVFLLLSGWGFCCKTLSDMRRQIVGFAVPGDLMGLRCVLLRTADHSSYTISACRICKLGREKIREIFEDHPCIAVGLLWLLGCHEMAMVERLVSLGRRTALESMAHLLVELHDRLRLVSLAEDGEFDCPLTQDHLADALGITSIHVNRLLRHLREADMVTFRNRRVVVHDLDRLVGLAGYDRAARHSPPSHLLELI